MAYELEKDIAIPSETSNGFRWNILTEYAMSDCKFFRFKRVLDVRKMPTKPCREILEIIDEHLLQLN